MDSADLRYERKVFAGNVAMGKLAETDLENISLPIYGMDFGYASDPSVIVRIHVIKRRHMRDIVYVAASIGAHGVPTRELPHLLDSVLHDPNAPVMAELQPAGDDRGSVPCSKC